MHRIVLIIALFVPASPLVAQDRPWNLYADLASPSLCDVVNAISVDGTGNVFRVELVVLSATGEMVLVSGADTVVPNVVVDTSSNVLLGGTPFGAITFADDGDGLRTAWWLSGAGTVMLLNSLTLAPSVSGVFPVSVIDAGCDACDFWDDQSVCPDGPTPDPPDGDPDPVVPPSVTINICGTNIGTAAALTLAGLMGIRFKRRIGRADVELTRRGSNL